MFDGSASSVIFLDIGSAFQLKRFEYNFEYDQLMKVNDKPYIDKNAEHYMNFIGFSSSR